MIVSKFKVTNTLDGFKELLRRVGLEMKLQAAQGAVYALEAGCHFWRNLAFFLEAQGQTFRLVNPYTLKRRREGEDLDRRKNDFRDAEMAAELLRTGKFTETELPQGIYAELRVGYQAYRRVRCQQTRVVNLLLSLLDGVFPEFCQEFREITGKTAMAVLSTYPAPSSMAQMSREGFVRRVHQAFPGQHLADQKLRSVHPLAQKSAGITAGAMVLTEEIYNLVEQLRLFQTQAQRWEDYLTALVQKAPEGPFLLSIPGVGPMTASGLLGELGPLMRFTHPKQLVKMAGTNPTESESAGKRSSRTPISKKGRPGLRWCLWMAAVSLVRHNQDFTWWAQALRERPSHPLKGREAMVAVGNRLLRVAYAMVKHQTMYQGSIAQPVAV
jgi:transposase